MLRNCVRLAPALALLVGCALVGCTADTATEPQTAAERQFSGQYPIRVVCTTGPVSDMLRNLGGDHLQVTALMGPGVDPHLYRAVPADVEELSRADMVFYNGMHLEGRMADLLERLSDRKPAYAVTQVLVDTKDPRLRKPPEFEGYYDPHVWHHPKMWAECVKYVAGVLAEFAPANRADYEKNRDAYLQQLDEVDQYCREQLATIPEEQRALVTAHDAFNYFCEAYGLESMPLKGVSTEEEVTIGRMDEVVEYLVSRKINAVFVESSTAPRVVQALIEPCREAGHEVSIPEEELYADALGSADSGADTYVGMIKSNVDTIVTALK